VRIDRSLRRGLAFMTFHFPEQVETNVLTIDATDPKSGTAEFKATAIRVEKIPVAEAAGHGNGAAVREPVGVAGGNGAGGNGAGGNASAGNGASVQDAPRPTRETV
jgi:hypothetical protein